MNKKTIKIILGLLLLFIAVWLVINYYSATGEKSFLKHLKGKTLKIEGFEITLAQREVKCYNHKVCSYLSNLFITKNGQDAGDNTSRAYRAKIIFNNGKKFICRMYIGRKGFSLSIPKYDTFGEEYPTHCYSLTDAPPELKEILEFLNLSIKDGQGKILIVNDNGNKVIFDKSLLR